MLIDTRPQRPERPERPPARRRRRRPDVSPRVVGGLTAATGLAVGSGAASAPVGYGMLLGALVALGLALGGGQNASWSGLRDHRQ
jgi:uncharacterized protein (DUF2062 family)